MILPQTLTFKQVIWIFVGFFIMECIVAVIILWKQIQIFFTPQNFQQIIMLQHNGDIDAFVEKTKGKITFEYKGGIYNLIQIEDEFNKEINTKSAAESSGVSETETTFTS